MLNIYIYIGRNDHIHATYVGQTTNKQGKIELLNQ